MLTISISVLNIKTCLKCAVVGITYTTKLDSDDALTMRRWGKSHYLITAPQNLSDIELN